MTEEQPGHSTSILIIGGGFAGLAAAREAARTAAHDASINISLIDRNDYTTLVPGLPEIAGGRYADGCITGSIPERLPARVTFYREQVTRVDLTSRTVQTDKRQHHCDRLIPAAGSATCFFGFNQHLVSVHLLESLDTARRINREFHGYLDAAAHPVAIIAGGGYTGLELACNLMHAATEAQKQCEVCVVEMKDSVLPNMPPWIQNYVTRQAKQQHISMLTGTSVTSFDGHTVTLSDGRSLDNAFLCWTTGTEFALKNISGDSERLKDGRFVVDKKLRLPGYPNVFAAGDAAAVEHNGEILRKAVNFSRGSGRQAGRNAVLSLLGKPLEDFRPRDLGWVIPFCDVGAGAIFNSIKLTGRIPLVLHYIMCARRNYSVRNSLFFLKRALQALTGRL